MRSRKCISIYYCAHSSIPLHSLATHSSVKLHYKKLKAKQKIKLTRTLNVGASASDVFMFLMVLPTTTYLLSRDSRVVAMETFKANRKKLVTRDSGDRRPKVWKDFVHFQFAVFIKVLYLELAYSLWVIKNTVLFQCGSSGVKALTVTWWPGTTETDWILLPRLTEGP